MDDQQPEVKAEQAPASVKKEPPIVAETRVLDGVAPNATSGKKKNSAKKQKTETGIENTMVENCILFFSFSERRRSWHLLPCNQKLFSQIQ